MRLLYMTQELSARWMAAAASLAVGGAVCSSRLVRTESLSDKDRSGKSASSRDAGAIDHGRNLEDVAEPAPLFRFGLVADIQYCDVDDTYNYTRTQLRKYRGALGVLRRAVEDWSGIHPDLAFVGNLGDIIDTMNKAEDRGTTAEATAAVLAEFDKLECPVVHLIGNHELYNFTRAETREVLGIRDPAYYSWSRDGWRFVVLDSYAKNCIDVRGCSEDHDKAYEWLAQYNQNELRHPVPGVRYCMSPVHFKAHAAAMALCRSFREILDFQDGRLPATFGDLLTVPRTFCPRRAWQVDNWREGLSGVDSRFVPFNGAIGSEQIAWLKAELAAATEDNENVVM